MILSRTRKLTLEEPALNGMRDAAKSLQEEFLDKNELENVSDERVRERLEHANAGITVNNSYGGVLSLFVDYHQFPREEHPLIYIGVIPELVLLPEEMNVEEIVTPYGEGSPYALAFLGLIQGVAGKMWSKVMYGGPHTDLSFGVDYVVRENLQDGVKSATIAGHRAVRSALQLKEDDKVKPLIQSYVNRELQRMSLVGQIDQQETYLHRAYNALVGASNNQTDSG